MDMMQIRKMVMAQIASGGLPAGYTRVEYLECSGTQYIATDYVAPAGVSIEWNYLITNSFSGDRMMWGAKNNNDSNSRCYGELYRTQWYGGNGYARYYPVLTGRGNAVNIKHNAKIDSSSFTIDGVSASPTSYEYVAPTTSIYIFAWNSDGTAQYIHNALRLYDLIFMNNGVLSANFIPCIRNSDNEPGVYDTVAGKFYTNAGTGTFIIPS